MSGRILIFRSKGMTLLHQNHRRSPDGQSARLTLLGGVDCIKLLTDSGCALGRVAPLRFATDIGVDGKIIRPLINMASESSTEEESLSIPTRHSSPPNG